MSRKEFIAAIGGMAVVAILSQVIPGSRKSEPVASLSPAAAQGYGGGYSHSTYGGA